MIHHLPRMTLHLPLHIHLPPFFFALLCMVHLGFSSPLLVMCASDCSNARAAFFSSYPQLHSELVTKTTLFSFCCLSSSFCFLYLFTARNLCVEDGSRCREAMKFLLLMLGQEISKIVAKGSTIKGAVMCHSF